MDAIFPEPNGMEAQICYFDSLWKAKRRLHRAA